MQLVGRAVPGPVGMAGGELSPLLPQSVTGDTPATTVALQLLSPFLTVTVLVQTPLQLLGPMLSSQRQGV